MTREEIRAWARERNGIGTLILDYGFSAVFLPEDAPTDVKCAWLRLQTQGRKDCRIIERWLHNEPLDTAKEETGQTEMVR